MPKDKEFIVSIKGEKYLFSKKGTEMCQAIFGSDILEKVYQKEHSYDTFEESERSTVNLDCMDIVLLLKTGTYVRIWNSEREWGGINAFAKQEGP